MPIPPLTIQDEPHGLPRQPVPLRLTCLVTGLTCASASNPTALCYHYSHTARGNAREYLSGGQVRLKKYFYVLRPLLAIRYLEAGLGLPPVRVEDLVAAVAPAALLDDIQALLAQKRATRKLGLGAPIPALDAFIAAELARHGTTWSGPGRPEPGADRLSSADLRAAWNRLFRQAIADAHAGRQPGGA